MIVGPALNDDSFRPNLTDVLEVLKAARGTSEADENKPQEPLEQPWVLDDVAKKLYGVDGFPLFSVDNTSLLKKTLSRELFLRLKPLRTSSGFTLHDVIKSGLENQDSKMGVYAGDKETYAVFKEFFDPLIESYQGAFSPFDNHISDYDSRKLHCNMDPQGKYILSVRARVARNISGYAFSTLINRQDRLSVERVITKALEKMNLQGHYWGLPDMTPEERNRLIDNHLLFNGVDRFQKSAGILRDWPEARGMYYNVDETLLVWVNEQDHMRIISMEPGSDMIAVFGRLVEGISMIGTALESEGYTYQYDDHYGYMSSEPSQLGTGLRCSVLIRLPLLNAHPKFRQICQDLGLGIRGTNGEHTPIVDGIVDISNKQRLGRTEVELVQLVIDGTNKLIEWEQRLERGESI